jgi:uncharacterized membrane protein
MARPHPVQHFRSRFLRGLLVVLPLLITVGLLRVLFDLVDGNVTPIVVAVFQALGAEDLDRWQTRLGYPIIGILLTVLLVYFIGLFAGNIAGRRAVQLLESWILRVPLVKGIYGSARQLLDAFTTTGKRTFSKVVMVEYPRRGLWTVGFVTAETSHRVPPGSTDEARRTVPVFLPTTPNPTSGWLVLVPASELLELDLSIEEGIKLVVSGGIVSPSELGDRLRPWGDDGTTT